MVRMTFGARARIRSIAADCGLISEDGGSSKAGTLTVPSGSNVGLGGPS
jgi:hypothetical protein